MRRLRAPSPTSTRAQRRSCWSTASRTASYRLNRAHCCMRRCRQPALPARWSGSKEPITCSSASTPTPSRIDPPTSSFVISPRPGRLYRVPLVPLTYTSRVVRLRSYWRWLGHRLWLSQPGRVFFTVALLVGVAAIVDARAHGARSGGAPGVLFARLFIGVVTLDAVGREIVSVVRRFILDGGPGRRSRTLAQVAASSVG